MYVRYIKISAEAGELGCKGLGLAALGDRPESPSIEVLISFQGTEHAFVSYSDMFNEMPYAYGLD